MHLHLNKKATARFIVSIIILTVSLILMSLLITQFVSKAEAKTSETICRGSVFAREKSSDTAKGIVATPLLCKTQDLQLPEEKDGSKQQVMKETADLMARCWWQFGEGQIADVFKEGSILKNSCMICYRVTTGKTKNFKEEISQEEFVNFLVQTPYIVGSEWDDKCKALGGFCAENEGLCSKGDGWESDKKNIICNKKYDSKDVCCYSDYSCLNNGGVCEDKSTDSDYVMYNKWDCPDDKTCYIKDVNYVTYARYIQSYKGVGNIIMTTPITPNEIYAISFGSPNRDCGWCKWAGASIGGAVGLTTGAIVTVYTLGAGSVAVPALVGAAATVGGGIGGTIGWFVGDIGADQVSKLFNRDKNTIYLTTFNQAIEDDRCIRLTDVKGE